MVIETPNLPSGASGPPRRVDVGIRTTRTPSPAWVRHGVAGREDEMLNAPETGPLDQSTSPLAARSGSGEAENTVSSCWLA